jgi:hypothetical protein
MLSQIPDPDAILALAFRRTASARIFSMGILERFGPEPVRDVWRWRSGGADLEPT